MMRLLRGFPVKYEAAFSEQGFKKLIEICIPKRDRLNLWFKEFARIYADHKTFMTDSENFKPKPGAREKSFFSRMQEYFSQ